MGVHHWAIRHSIAVSSISQFLAATREHHLELALHLFGYFYKNPNHCIVLDSRELIIDDSLQHDSFHPDFLGDYPDAKDDVATDFLPAFGRELHITFFWMATTCTITLRDGRFLD